MTSQIGGSPLIGGLTYLSHLGDPIGGNFILEINGLLVIDWLGAEKPDRWLNLSLPPGNITHIHTVP